jgi:hypothetical protein
LTVTDADLAPRSAKKVTGTADPRGRFFKLWRFARPYQWQLSTGFVLTLMSTGGRIWCRLHPTTPLTDDVLIPYRNGKSIDPESGVLVFVRASALSVGGLGFGLDQNLYSGFLLAADWRRTFGPPPTSIY